MNGLRFRAVRPSEVPFVAAQNIAAFGGSREEHEAVEQRLRVSLDAGELWGMDADGIIAGHCRLMVVEHFFGGRPVRSLDVAGLAVAGDRRRRGVATALMEAAAAWGAHQGIALSLLFPGVPSLYRRLGWEHAGTFPRYEVPAGLTAPPGETMRVAGPEDWPGIEACHDRFAPTVNGAARRRPAQWRHLRTASAVYVLDGGAGVDAYVLTYAGSQPDEDAGSPATVDWAATTPRGLRSVVALLASGKLGEAVAVRAPAATGWSPWSSSWTAPSGSGLFWMARPLVLASAVAERGFPLGVDAAVTFAVDDTLLAEVRGPWRLEIAGGRGSLEPSDTADVVMDARAVGPLFTGFRTPQELAWAGLLDGTPADLDTLGAMFSGGEPVALDFF